MFAMVVTQKNLKIIWEDAMSDLNSLLPVQIVSLHNTVSCICDSEMQSDFIGLIEKERKCCLVDFPYLSLRDFKIVAILPLYKPRGTWSQNVSCNCLWDHYWGSTGSLASGQFFSLSLTTVPKVFVKVNSLQLLSCF